MLKTKDPLLSPSQSGFLRRRRLARPPSTDSLELEADADDDVALVYECGAQETKLRLKIKTHHVDFATRCSVPIKFHAGLWYERSSAVIRSPHSLSSPPSLTCLFLSVCMSFYLSIHPKTDYGVFELNLSRIVL